MGAYLSQTLFFTSGLHLTGREMKEAIGRWSRNWPMCELTEKVKAACHRLSSRAAARFHAVEDSV